MALSSKLKQWQAYLLDMSRRNKLLYFSLERHPGIMFRVEEPAALFSRITTGRRPLTVSDLPCDLQPDELDQKLLRLRTRAREALRDRGTNILFLTFGMLEWHEPGSEEETIHSPLVLVPVQLLRAGITSPYQLQLLQNEDITINPTLRERLTRDFGVQLPAGISDGDGEVEVTGGLASKRAAAGLMNTFAAIRKALPRTSNAWVVRNDVCLSIFSFTKLVMYQDLERYQGLIRAHPILKAIGGDTPPLPEPLDAPRVDELDQRFHPRDVLQVLDADSSQQVAIQLAKEGKSFVLHGPPGTGKSQTIANIIAECMGQGKRVLFVSEKMAALEVVHQRLESVGLAEYCLDLHSHRMDKKAFLEEVQRSLLAAETAARSTSATAKWRRESDALLTTRSELNAYVRELHKQRTPLEWSAFEVYGKLAALHAVPDVDCSIPDPIQTPPHQLDYARRRLQGLMSRADVLVSQTTHPWRQTRIEALTQELAADIRVHFERAVSLVEQLQTALEALDIALGDATLPATWTGAAHGLAIADVALRTPLPEPHWLQAMDTRQFKQVAATAADRARSYHDGLTRLEQWYKPDALDLDPAALASVLEDEATWLPQQIRSDDGDPYDVALYQAEAIDAHLRRFADVSTRLNTEAQQMATALGHEVPDTVQDIYDLVELCKHILDAPPLPRRWLDPDEFAAARAAALDAADRYQRASALRERLLKHYEPAVFDLDLETLAGRFASEYESLWRYLKPGYWRDAGAVRAHLRAGAQRSAHELVNDMRQVQQLLQDERHLSERRLLYATALGTWFAEADTDWTRVLDAISWVERLYVLLAGVPPDQHLQRLITGDARRLEPVRMRWQRARAALSEWEQEATYLESLLYLDQLPGEALGLVETNLAQLGQWCRDLLNRLDAYWSAARQLAEVRHTDTALAERRREDLLNDIDLIARLRTLRAWFEAHEDELSQQFGQSYSGLETNWAAVLAALGWCDELRAICGEGGPSDRLVSMLSRGGDEKAVARLQEARRAIQQLLASLEAEWAFFDTVLPRDALASPGMSFESTPLMALRDRLASLMSELPRLEEWVDFRQYWRACELAGLGLFLEAITRQSPVPTNLLDLFEKRFYWLWLDSVYETCPDLAHFRGRAHEQVIEQFRRLDDTHIRLARHRLADTLAAQRAAAISDVSSGPDSVRATTVTDYGSPLADAMAFLRHELGKKRHRSIRQIVQGAGSAILALKPCWMVSPLSVSQFVTPESVDFDLVIFDEASQICPEDAISSILRGRQVVVVGDPKQLPPTRFFAKSVSDNDPDDEETAEEVYESILDECMPVMPGRSLLWHYRSRHESLIAFSNRHFYDGRLYTFPGPQARHEDGVRFVHVPEGRYDRGHTRTNRQEARRVVELVFEHFARHPDRSLGVVALSEAQQTSIETELEARRRERPDFEQFFDENRADAFFVKNLESVQGDERDVIMLSIGYGKDATGRVYQQFGPINGAGGERRLNVAITRARYHFIVVSSIRAEDLDSSGTRSSGARLLRDYLAYAERGPDALMSHGAAKANAASGTAVSFDSPFEEDVYRALQARGLALATQVGCSGYRIDLAVRDPNHLDKFVLGIECDGATYHSAPTARDRDRLRQRHLESLGWHIHRIWSRDWIRDREGEIERVLDRVDETSALAVVQAPSASSPISVEQRASDANDVQAVHATTSPQPQPAAAAASVTTLRTCETCKQFLAKTPSAFLCLRDATIKRRDPRGQTPACPGWTRPPVRVVQ